MKLKDKVAIITGASRGIDRAVCVATNCPHYSNREDIEGRASSGLTGVPSW